MRGILTFTLLCALGLWGCGSSGNSVQPAPGEMKMSLVDRSAAFDAVNIVVTEVSVHSAGSDSISGWSVLDDTTRTFDLLTLRNGASAILGDHFLSAGHYTQIRLKIGAGSSVVVDGAPHPLNVPGGMQSGLKLNHEFDIVANTLYELTLDFDASRSIHATGGGDYNLSPVIRVVANVISGTISGTISPASAHADIWTLADADTVSAAADTTSGTFRLMALPAGLYTVHVVPTAGGYADSTFAGVAVVAGQNTNLGVITLHP